MADQQKDSPDPPVPDSSPDDSRPDSSSSSEKAIGGGESSTDSKPFSPLTSGTDSPVGEGPAASEEDLAEKARQLQIQATTRGLHSGKLRVFRKFNHDDLAFCTRPDGRQRHRAQRQRHCSEGGIPELGGSLENPLAALQVEDPGAQAVLNQAGAIVGMDEPASEFANLRGDFHRQFHPRLGDPEHSVSSGPTVPIVEANAGNYSPVEERSSSTEVWYHGTSPGSSGSCDLNISPPPEVSSASRYLPCRLRESASSPVSTTDSEGPPAERPVRRRRVGATSHPLAIPARSQSAGAARSLPESSVAVPKCMMSKDSSVDSSGERASSEDEFSAYPHLLSASVKSESCLPVPDLGVTESLQQDMDALRTEAQTRIAAIVSGRNLETETGIEPEPKSVASRGPNTVREVGPAGEDARDPFGSFPDASTGAVPKRTRGSPLGSSGAAPERKTNKADSPLDSSGASVSRSDTAESPAPFPDVVPAARTLQRGADGSPAVPPGDVRRSRAVSGEGAEGDPRSESDRATGAIPKTTMTFHQKSRTTDPSTGFPCAAEASASLDWMTPPSQPDHFWGGPALAEGSTSSEEAEVQASCWLPSSGNSPPPFHPDVDPIVESIFGMLENRDWLHPEDHPDDYGPPLPDPPPLGDLVPILDPPEPDPEELEPEELEPEPELEFRSGPRQGTRTP